MLVFHAVEAFAIYHGYRSLGYEDFAQPETQKFVDEQVRAGHFASADEMLEAGIARLMLDPEPDELDDDLLAAIDRAEAQLERGEGLPVDEAFKRLRQTHLAG